MRRWAFSIMSGLAGYLRRPRKIILPCPIGAAGLAAHVKVVRRRAPVSVVRDCGYYPRECGRGDRCGRGRCGSDFGDLAPEDPRAAAQKVRAAVEVRLPNGWPMTPSPSLSRASEFEWWGRHRGRSQDVFRPGCLRSNRDCRAHRAEHQRVSALLMQSPPNSSQSRSMRSFPTSRQRCQDRNAVAEDVIEIIAAGWGGGIRAYVVLDPVLATVPAMTSAPAARELLKRALIPRALSSHPTCWSRRPCFDAPVAQSRGRHAGARRTAAHLGARAVLMKGGHGAGAQSLDLLIEPHGMHALCC